MPTAYGNLGAPEGHRAEATRDFDPAVSVAAGSDRSCAVKADGGLACFGPNSDGQRPAPADLGRPGALRDGGWR